MKNSDFGRCNAYIVQKSCITQKVCSFSFHTFSALADLHSNYLFFNAFLSLSQKAIVTNVHHSKFHNCVFGQNKNPMKITLILLSS